MPEPAGGHVRAKKGGMVELGIRLDAETFAQIRALARREGTSFAAQVRVLLEWGLMAAEEDDG